jgi:hypothetical protein
VDLQKAIENVDNVVAQWVCNRDQRRIIETSWQTILGTIRKPAEPPPDKPEPDEMPE